MKRSLERGGIGDATWTRNSSESGGGVVQRKVTSAGDLLKQDRDCELVGGSDPGNEGKSDGAVDGVKWWTSRSIRIGTRLSHPEKGEGEFFFNSSYHQIPRQNKYSRNMIIIIFTLFSSF